ncbi:hypothetical protein HPB48_010881 [Haemaphysalis longicornis]|uniref:DDE Tnp4 domain-containing protein n=1 Tax=Haemaphysalis longicornis TaxID=44386 RepID=A0A9J6GA38_HAELO|nr:hypothetical protein HPB48_010881 [Haemaphysalis longicornis]
MFMKAALDKLPENRRRKLLKAAPSDRARQATAGEQTICRLLVPAARSVVQSYRDDEFKHTFRLSRETFAEVAARYKTAGAPQIAADKTVAIALAYLGSQASMYAIAEIRRGGVDQSPFYQGAPAKCSSGYTFGDSAYPLSPWLLTPYRDTERTFPAWKRAFNKRLSQKRVAIENTFGLLKQRFRRLYLVDAKSVGRCCYIVMAANAERDFLDDPEIAPCPDEVENDEDVSVPSSSVAEDMRRRIAMKQC